MGKTNGRQPESVASTALYSRAGMGPQRKAGPVPQRVSDMDNEGGRTAQNGEWRLVTTISCAVVCIVTMLGRKARTNNISQSNADIPRRIANHIRDQQVRWMQDEYPYQYHQQ
jgi:hypothetical protein